MKQFFVDIENCSAAEFERHAMWILKEVQRARLQDEPTHMPLTSSKAAAEKEAALLEEKLTALDARIRRGVQLIASKLRQH